MGWFSKSIALERQLAALAEVGLVQNADVQADDLFMFQTQAQLEAKPYTGLVEVLGMDIEREPFTPICDRLWMCDFERIEDHGAYRDVLVRLERMSSRGGALASISDFVDLEADTAWVEFDCAGGREHWDLEVNDDWLDPQIITRYDELLGRMRSATRLYVITGDYGQVAFLAAFTEPQKSAFERLTKLRSTRVTDAQF